MQVFPNIPDKNYKRLTLEVSPDGFSYCCTDTLSGKVHFIREISFAGYPHANGVEDHYWKAFVDHTELTRPYDEVLVLHRNNLNTFVPKALYDPEYLGSYLQYNTKVFETDFFESDEIAGHEMYNVYIPYVNINNFLIDQFGTFTYKNANSVLVSRILELTRNVDERQVYAHFGPSHFEIVISRSGQLELFNSFEHRAKEDFVYYLLFAAEQLNLNPEQFRLFLLGDISAESEYYEIAYKYVRNVAFADVTAMPTGLDDKINRRHFNLLQP